MSKHEVSVNPLTTHDDTMNIKQDTVTDGTKRVVITHDNGIGRSYWLEQNEDLTVEFGSFDSEGERNSLDNHQFDRILNEKESVSWFGILMSACNGELRRYA